MSDKLRLYLTLALASMLVCINASAQDCISGTVYNDFNLNCVQNAGEPGLAGVTMILVSSTGDVIEQVTNDTGFYLFCGLMAGEYLLITQVNSPLLEPNPATQSLILSAGQSLDNVNICVTDLSLLGAIAGSAFIDLNDNGIRDNFEPCLANYPVTLDGGNGSVTVSTNALGMFRFDRLQPDDYIVSMGVDIPNTEWVSGPSQSVGLMAGQTIDDMQFVIRPSMGFGSIIDVICYDLNADGVNDPATEPPLGGIPVDLLDAQSQVIGTAVSDSKGVYSFISLPPGNYIVRAAFNPEEYTPTTPTTYDVSLPANTFRRPGPFYGQPLRKIFKCGMAVTTMADYSAFNGESLTVKDIRDRTSATPGTNLNWSSPFFTHTDWSANKLGRIFGIAIDKDYDVYVTSTQLYGGGFITSGNPIIKRVDAFTGMVSPFVTASNTPTVVNSTAMESTGELGNICNNSTNDLLYVTNLKDFSINVVGAYGNSTFGSGVIAQVFDPNFNSTPGGQEVYGIAYDSGRIYYARSTTGSTQTQIWSVAVDAAGLIIPVESFEFNVQLYSSLNTVVDIAISQNGNKMLLGERGGPHSARILEYTGGHLAWAFNQQLFIGFGSAGANAAGGVDYCYGSFTGDTPLAGDCDQFITGTGNALRIDNSTPYNVYGVAVIPAAGNTFSTYPGLNSIMIDSDNDLNAQDKSTLGDVEVFDCGCQTDEGCNELFDLSVTPTQSIDGHCCLILDYNNNGSETVYGVELVALDGVTFNNGYVAGPGLFVPNFSNSSITIVPNGFVPMPAVTNLVTGLCLEDINAVPQFILVNYLDSSYHVFCTDTIPAFCEPEASCLYIVSDSLVCDSLGYKYSVTVTNPAGADFSVGYIKFNITPPISGATYIPNPPNFILSPPLAPGDTAMVMFWIQTSQDLYGDSLCFILSAHDSPEERLCCAEIDTCIAFPLCDPCPFVDAEIIPVSDNQAIECCFELLITDTFTLDPSLFQSIQTTILSPGITFSGLVTLPALIDGWNVSQLVPNKDLIWTHNSGMIPSSVGYNLFDFCVNGTTSTDSIYIAINWLGADSMVICTDTLAIFCPFCLTVVNDSLTCRTNPDGSTDYVYTFQVQNYSPFPVNTIGIVENPSSNTNITPDIISIPTIPAFPPGGISIPVSIVIDTSELGVNHFCFDIVLRQVILDSIDITCCYATHCIDLPPCDSLPEFLCPDPALVDDIPCTLEFLPVCGCDSVTYSNLCHAMNAGITLWSPGTCDPMMLQDTRLNLQATLVENFSVQIDWSLIADQAFGFFTLLKLYEDGSSKTIATVPFHEGQVKYDFLDEQADPGANRYQVIATDLRGIPIFSNTAAVFVQDIEGRNIAVRVFPVPASNQLFVASSKNGVCDISILLMDGRVMPAVAYELLGTPVSVDISLLPPGAYSVRLHYADGAVAHQRFVKAE